MPTRPPRRCTTPGCHQLAPTGGKCSSHRQRKQADINRTRGSSTQQGYGARWRPVRDAVLRDEPDCRHCNAPAEHVDHINGDRNDWRRANLQPLCHPCHSRKTARHDGRWGHGTTGT